MEGLLHLQIMKASESLSDIISLSDGMLIQFANNSLVQEKLLGTFWLNISNFIKIQCTRRWRWL